MIRWRTEDELTCACGNSPQDGGFYAANASGEEVDPTEKTWDGATWLCAGCGAVEIVADFTSYTCAGCGEVEEYEKGVLVDSELICQTCAREEEDNA
jgi:hypothetical protein